MLIIQYVSLEQDAGDKIVKCQQYIFFFTLLLIIKYSITIIILWTRPPTSPFRNATVALLKFCKWGMDGLSLNL